MAKRRTAYRKKNQNKFSMFLVTLVVLMIMLIVAVRSVELHRKLDLVQQQEDSLNAQLAEEQQRTEEIEEYGKYTQTKKFAEELAKEILGLVHEGEILFKEE